MQFNISFLEVTSLQPVEWWVRLQRGINTPEKLLGMDGLSFYFEVYHRIPDCFGLERTLKIIQFHLPPSQVAPRPVQPSL